MATLTQLRSDITQARTLGEITEIMKADSANKRRVLGPALLAIHQHHAAAAQMYERFIATIPEGVSLSAEVNADTAKDVARVLLPHWSGEHDAHVRDCVKALIQGDGDSGCVVLTAQMGFCGTFHRGMLKQARRDYFTRPTVHVVGKKGASELGVPSVMDFDMKNAKKPSEVADVIYGLMFGRSDGLVQALCRNPQGWVLLFAEGQPEKRADGQTGAVEAKPPKFTSGAEGVVLPLLPKARPSTQIAPLSDGRCLRIPHPIVEPDEASFTAGLTVGLVILRLLYALVSSAYHENCARFEAMNQAADNIQDHIRDLERDYTRTRQTNITRELIEIIGGAEAYARSLE